uniref:Uncharacterized protein n=1 Tax=Arundo donax TaxID=35708 RepID=A0A0A9BCA6_ARUDO
MILFQRRVEGELIIAALAYRDSRILIS